MKELKPCPFCGNEDIKIEYGGIKVIPGNPTTSTYSYVIFCIKCDTEMMVCGDECASNRQDAIDQWNTRQEVKA